MTDTSGEVAAILQYLDTDDGHPDAGNDAYNEVAADLLATASTVHDVSLYLQRLDYLADRLADHPKYFEHIARTILGITPNPHPDEDR